MFAFGARWRSRGRVVLVIAATIASSTLLGSSTAAGQGGENASDGSAWTMGGQNFGNTRSNPNERTIGPDNASALRVKWVADTHGDVSATPAVVGNAVYFP